MVPYMCVELWVHVRIFQFIVLAYYILITVNVVSYISLLFIYAVW
jgi:hypothetical protein